MNTKIIIVNMIAFSILIWSYLFPQTTLNIAARFNEDIYAAINNRR